MTASFHDCGASPVLKVWLKQLSSIGVICVLNVLYHSDEYPSAPGALLAFNLEMALFSSSSFISAIISLFCFSPMDGRSSELRNVSIIVVSALVG